MTDTKTKYQKRRQIRLRYALRRRDARRRAINFVGAICRLCEGDYEKVLRELVEARQSIDNDRNIPVIERVSTSRKIGEFIDALATIIEKNERIELEELELFPLDDIDEWGHYTECGDEDSSYMNDNEEQPTINYAAAVVFVNAFAEFFVELRNKYETTQQQEPLFQDRLASRLNDARKTFLDTPDEARSFSLLTELFVQSVKNHLANDSSDDWGDP